MRFTRTTFTLMALSTLAVLSQAALTQEEVEAAIAKDGPGANLCGVCLEKAMVNHFPHACSNINHAIANSRPGGANAREERCVCLAFQDLYWMKADCSKECVYTHNPKAMAHFLPAEKIEGCGNWIDFTTGQEKVVEGHPPKDPNYKPEEFPIVVPPPEASEGLDEEGRNYEVNVSFTTKNDKNKKAEVEDKKAEVEDKKPEEKKEEGAAPKEATVEAKKEEKREQKEEL